MLRWDVASPIRIPEPAAISAQLRLWLRASEKQASIGVSARVGCVGPVSHPTHPQQRSKLQASLINGVVPKSCFFINGYLIPWCYILQKSKFDGWQSHPHLSQETQHSSKSAR